MTLGAPQCLLDSLKDRLDHVRFLKQQQTMLGETPPYPPGRLGTWVGCPTFTTTCPKEGLYSE